MQEPAHNNSYFFLFPNFYLIFFFQNYYYSPLPTSRGSEGLNYSVANLAFFSPNVAFFTMFNICKILKQWTTAYLALIFYIKIFFQLFNIARNLLTIWQHHGKVTVGSTPVQYYNGE